MPQRIFISYRRDDSAGDAGRLADHLHRRFGADRVFLDIDTIDPGTDFVGVLRASLQQTAAMLVVIGPRWMSLRDAQGARRLDDPGDFVRLEVEAGLGRGIPVVPVLVQGATLPSAKDLPPSLAALATRHAATLDHAEFHADAERLCDRLRPVIDASEVSPLRRWWPAAAIASVLVLGLTAYLLRTTDDEPVRVPPAGSNAVAPAVSPVAAPAVAPLTVPLTTESTSPLASTPTRPSASPPANTRGPAATRPSTGALGAAADTAVRQAQALEQEGRVKEILSEAAVQGRRGQTLEALATLARARALAPGSVDVRRTQEDAAMGWIRNVRVESGKTTFTEAIKPALAVVDASLGSATGTRRADLLAHSGWAAFLMWRDGNRAANPEEWYREALMVDAGNPYANAMLAHWVLFQRDDLTGAVTLFDTALKAGRAVDAIRPLQWGAYNNAGSAATAERVRLADAMRRTGERLSAEQASALWAPYYFAFRNGQDKDRQMLLEALPPGDHISTLGWAFQDYASGDEFRRQTIRYYTSLLNARAGRTDEAVADLRALDKELSKEAGSILREPVQTALKQLLRGPGGR